jgi:lincosamide nucleotidyltransferase A/C/D/E
VEVDLKAEMDAATVLRVLELLDSASIEVWLDGGWGVDALLGEQTRSHSDLDVISSARDVARICEALAPAGFSAKPGGTPSNFVLADPLGREVDVHAIEFDDHGYGIFPLPDGRKWPFPPAAFAGRGRVGGRETRCLSAEAQVQCHGQGYEPSEKDLRDMESLQARFGVVLPLHLCRQQP